MRVGGLFLAYTYKDIFILIIVFMFIVFQDTICDTSFEVGGRGMGKERIPTRIPTLDKPWTVLCRITKSKVHDYPVCQLVPKVKAGLNALFTSGFLILTF